MTTKAECALPRDIAAAFEPAVDGRNISAAVAVRTAAPVIGQRMPDGMIYAGRAADGPHHLLVEPEDVRGPDGNRLRLTFDEAAASARARGLDVPSIEDLDVLAKSAGAIGGFMEGGWYWSASETNRNLVWIERFSDGHQTFNFKNSATYLRCTRRCLLI